MAAAADARELGALYLRRPDGGLMARILRPGPARPRLPRSLHWSAF